MRQYLKQNAHTLLHWDMHTYMPKKGIENRSEQISMIESMRHNKLISEELFESVQNMDKGNLSEDEKIMLEKLSYDITKARKIPQEFIEEHSKVASLSFCAWKEAREKNDFEIFEPYLEKIVDLYRKKYLHKELKSLKFIKSTNIQI